MIVVQEFTRNWKDEDTWLKAVRILLHDTKGDLAHHNRRNE